MDDEMADTMATMAITLAAASLLPWADKKVQLMGESELTGLIGRCETPPKKPRNVAARILAVREAKAIYDEAL